jgi:cytochrome c oxidase subunit 1
MFSGANLLILYLLKWENLNLDLDPLLLKNMVFLFGHTLVNITLYFCVASIYEILPKYTNRPWKTKKSVVIAWNSSLFFVLTAYLHHLNMDFDQPTGLQFLGQIASYFSVVPATAVTIIGAISQIYKSGIKLSFTPLAFGLGILGWVTGGFAAVVDAGVPVNYTFHNTLWVPAHFHTYFLTGVVFMILGFVHYYAKDVPEKLKGLCKNEGLAKFSLWIMTISGYGFAIMFYISGVAGVPRRFASYEYILLESVKETGIVTGYYAVFFAIIFCVGLLIRYKTYFDKSVL